MFFPGVLRGRPGTSTRHHPHEPTASKPVVPEDACTAAVYPVRVRATWGTGRLQNEIDAVPSHLRNPSDPAVRPLLLGGAASHLSGLALCGSVPRLDSRYPLPQPFATPLDTRFRSFRRNPRGICGRLSR